MKARGSGWCCNETAASRSAAAQPSVRRQSVARSSGASTMPSARNSASASSSEKLRSAARISVRLPSRRRRPSPIGGSAARDDDEPQGRRREAHEPFEILVDGVDDLVEVVEHEHDRLLGAFERVGERGRHQAHRSSAREGSPPAPRPLRRPSPWPAPPGPRARSGGGPRHRCRATARRPVPADGPRRSTSSATRSCRHRPEAATSVTGPCTPVSSRSSSRWRSDGSPRPAGDRELRRQQRVGHGGLPAWRGIMARWGTPLGQSENQSYAESAGVCVRRGADGATHCCAPDDGATRGHRADARRRAMRGSTDPRLG